MRVNCEHPGWRIIKMVISSRVLDPLQIKNYMIISCKNCGDYRVLNGTYEELAGML